MGMKTDVHNSNQLRYYIVVFATDNVSKHVLLHLHTQRLFDAASAACEICEDFPGAIGIYTNICTTGSVWRVLYNY